MRRYLFTWLCCRTYSSCVMCNGCWAAAAATSPSLCTVNVQFELWSNLLCDVKTLTHHMTGLLSVFIIRHRGFLRQGTCVLCVWSETWYNEATLHVSVSGTFDRQNCAKIAQICSSMDQGCSQLSWKHIELHLHDDLPECVWTNFVFVNVVGASRQLFSKQRVDYVLLSVF